MTDASDSDADDVRAAGLRNDEACAGLERCLQMCSSPHTPPEERQYALELLHQAVEPSTIDWFLHALTELSVTMDDTDAACFALRFIETIVADHREALYSNMRAHQWLALHFSAPRDGPEGTKRLLSACAVTPRYFCPDELRSPRSILPLLQSIMKAVSTPQENERWVSLIQLARDLDFFLREVCQLAGEMTSILRRSLLPTLTQDVIDDPHRRPVVNAACKTMAKLLCAVSIADGPEFFTFVAEGAQRLIAAARVSVEASQGIGEVASDDADIFKHFAKLVLAEMLQVCKDASVPAELRSKALWAITALQETSPGVVLKNKKVSDELFVHCIEEIKGFADVIVSAVTMPDVGRTESSFSALHALDLLSKTFHNNPAFTRKLKRAIADLASPTRSWKENVAAVAVFMYGAEGVRDRLNDDAELAAALGRLLLSDHPVTRFYALRSLTEAPQLMVLSSIAAIIPPVLRDIDSPVVLFQQNAVETIAWIASFVSGLVSELNDMKKADSEDDVMDFGTDDIAADPVLQEATKDASAKFDAAAPQLLEAALRVFRTSPYPIARNFAARAIGMIMKFPSTRDSRFEVFDIVHQALDHFDERSKNEAEAPLRCVGGQVLAEPAARQRDEVFGAEMRTYERIRMIETLVSTLSSFKGIYKRASTAPDDVKAGFVARLELIAQRLSRTFNAGMRHDDALSRLMVSAWNGLLPLFSPMLLSEHVAMTIQVACWAVEAQIPPPVELSQLSLEEQNDPALQKFEVVLDGVRKTLATPKEAKRIESLIETAMDLFVTIVSQVNRKMCPPLFAAVKSYAFDIWVATRIENATEDTERAIRYISDPLALLAMRTMPPQLFAFFVFKVLEVNFTNPAEDIESMSFQAQSCSRAIERLNVNSGLAFFKAGFSHRSRFEGIVQGVCQMILNALDCWADCQIRLHLWGKRAAADDDSDAGEPEQRRRPRAEAEPQNPNQRQQPSSGDDSDVDVEMNEGETRRLIHNAEIIVNHGAAVIGQIIGLVDRFFVRPDSLTNTVWTVIDRVEQFPPVDHIGQVRAAMTANINLLWWTAKYLDLTWPHAPDLIRTGLSLSMRELDQYVVPFIDNENGQSAFSFLNELSLQLRQVPAEVSAVHFAPELLRQAVGKATVFLLDKRSGTKKFAASATNALSFVMTAFDWRPEETLSGAAQPLFALLQMFSRHVPCKGDATEAVVVYATLARWLTTPEHPAFHAPDAIKSTLIASIKRSKYATEEIKALLTPAAAAPAPV